MLHGSPSSLFSPRFAPRPFLTSSPIGDNNCEVSGVKDSIASAKPIYELLHPRVVHAVKVNVTNMASDRWWTWIPHVSMTNLMRWIAEVCCAFLVRMSDELLQESHDEWFPQNVCCADGRHRSCR